MPKPNSSVAPVGSFRLPAKLSLMLSHCAGMVDLVALPLWMGVLIANRQLDPQQAGGLLTLFLLGAVASSLFFAPRLQRISGRHAAATGFAIAGLAFFALSQVVAFAAMAGLHLVAGLSAGCGLTMAHGAIGRSSAPHRLFALASMALGVFGVAFMALTPQAMASFGGPALFWVLGGLMVTAAVFAAFAFPMATRTRAETPGQPRESLDKSVWLAVGGISCMALVQALTFSFLERVGVDRGFGAATVAGVLVAMGLACLLPAPLAAWLETRWSVRKVVVVAPWLQAALAALIFATDALPLYACAAMLFPCVIIFTHPFVFGLIAQLDPTGRAVAATPAMVMTGAAVGPILGGTLVKFFGYSSLALAAGTVACVGVACFVQATKNRPALAAAT